MDIKLPEYLRKKAEVELNENPSRVSEDIEHLKSWLAKQPHLRAKEDDHHLLCFLRGTKFSLEKAKEKIELFYTFRTLLPEIFSNRDPFLPELQELLRIGYVIPLPTPNEKGERILLFRAVFNPPETKPENLFKMILILIDILLNEDDHFVIAGVTSFIDMTSATMGHCTIFTPTMLSQFVKITQHAYPIRIKGMHFASAPSFADLVYRLFTFAFSEKVRKRITLASSLNPQCGDVPVKLLPIEYGGEAESVDVLAKQWKEKVESYREWLLDDSKFCSIEEKRVGKPCYAEELFGTDGSFRKLDVD